jgi:enolase-phosphatase E1
MTTALPRLYLLDVEGTVAPISLVYEQLFPYARKHFAEFLEEHSAEPAVQADLRLLTEENRADPEAPQIVDPGHSKQTIAYLNWLMDRDRKSTALKSLQGRVWKRVSSPADLKGILVCRRA